jgi:hypothetical protein
MGSNPFLPSSVPNQKRSLWQLDVSAYEHPRWWCDCFGWIAFFSKDILDMPSALLRTLKYSQFTFHEDVGYALPHYQADEWLHLDRQLGRAYDELKLHYSNSDIPSLAPSNPWAFGYLRTHPKHGTLSLCLKKSKQWFGVWFSLLSYIIAWSETRELQLTKDTCLAKQKWKDVLVAKCADININAGWIDLLLDTDVASFSTFVWRTGTFVYITPGDAYERENRFQPPIKWLIDYGVPVWYRWDKEAGSLPQNQYLAPLEFQLQEADSFMRKSPSLLPAPIDASPAAPAVNKDPPISTTQMDAFFKLREERAARLIANETSQQ